MEARVRVRGHGPAGEDRSRGAVDGMVKGRCDAEAGSVVSMGRLHFFGERVQLPYARTPPLTRGVIRAGIVLSPSFRVSRARTENAAERLAPDDVRRTCYRPVFQHLRPLRVDADRCVGALVEGGDSRNPQPCAANCRTVTGGVSSSPVR